MRTNRQPNFEILRVMAMFFIVMWHYVVHGLMSDTTSPTGAVPTIDATSPLSLFNYAAIEFIAAIGNVAVNAYVLITGYFSATSDKQPWDKVLKLWLPKSFYGILIVAVFYFFGEHHLAMKELVGACFPITRYWFINMYVALIILAPFLNLIIRQIDRRKHIGLLLCLGVICINPPLGHIYSEGGHSLIWFIFLYFAGGFIRLYNPFENYKKHFLKCFFAVIVITAALNLLRGYIIYEFRGRPICFSALFMANNSLSFFSAFFLFLWAKHKQFADNQFNRFLVRIAPFTFAVYLIHENNLVRPWLWSTICPAAYVDTWILIPLLFASSVSVFLICIGIDCLRTKLFDHLHLNERAHHLFAKLTARSKLLRRN